MSFLRKLFRLQPPEDWRLVKSIEMVVWKTDKPEDKGSLYFHLFESNRKNRKIEYTCTVKDVTQETVEATAKRFDVYQKKIYRWVNGRLDPEIPTYEETEVEDTFNKLKGKI
jgi:hypothetical protein